MVLTLSSQWKLNGNSKDELNPEDQTAFQSVDTGITYSPGKEDLCAGFDAYTSVITTADRSDINNIFDGGATVTCWIYPLSEGIGNFATIISKLRWYWEIQAVSGQTVKMAFLHQFSGTAGAWLTLTRPVRLNQWNFVSLSYDSSSDANSPDMWVATSAQTITEVTSAVGTRTSDTAQPLLFGDNNLVDGRNFHGFIDDLRIHDSVTSDTADIISIYNEYSDRQPEAFIGNKEIKTAWPVTDGLVARTTKQTGRTTNLVPEEPTKVRLHQRWALGGR